MHLKYFPFKKAFYGVLVLAAIISHACNNNQTKTLSVSDGSPALFSDVFDIQKIIRLETNDSCLLTRIFKIEFSEEYIFVLSSNQVYAFNHNGKYICRIGKKGNGPNEMLLPSDFDLSPNKNQLAIWDNLRRKMNIFDLKGKFIESFAPPVIRVTNFKWATKTTFYFDTEFKQQDGEQFRLLEYNKQSKSITKRLPYPASHEGYSILNYNAFPSFKKKTCYKSALIGDIYSIDSDDNRPLLKIDFEKLGLSEEIVNKFEGDTPQLVKEMDAKGLFWLVSFYELESYYAFGYVKSKEHYSNIQSFDKSINKTIKQYNPFDLLSSFTPCAKYNNELACISYPVLLKSNFKENGRLVKANRTEDYNIVNNMCTTLKSNDNPVLIIVKLKS